MQCAITAACEFHTQELGWSAQVVNLELLLQNVLEVESGVLGLGDGEQIIHVDDHIDQVLGCVQDVEAWVSC
jgi:hypothetical protein